MKANLIRRTSTGIAGLACALALRRVGHHVQVLERTTREAAVRNPPPIHFIPKRVSDSRPCPSFKQHGHGGIRVPPNLSKILFHWGLREPLMARATVTKKLDFMRCECPLATLARLSAPPYSGRALACG